MSGGVDNGGRSEPRAWAEREPWRMGARGVRRGHPVMARLCLDAFLSARRWQSARDMRSPASNSGNISPWCVLGRLAMARLRPDAFPGGNPWQVFHFVHPKSGLGRENRQFVARFARHASKMSWRWQDMRAMHPKSPANRLSGTHRAKILPGRSPFRCTNPSNHARRADLAIRRRRTALAPATPVPPNGASRPQRRRPHGTAAFGARHPSQRQAARATATSAPSAAAPRRSS